MAGMHTDGDGWVVCAAGHRHWGRFGAAGLLLRHPRGGDEASVLLQHRAAWSHHGDTWGLPGGARDSHETPEQAALREAVEESGLDVAQVTVTGEWVDDHGGWSYTTVLARADSELEASAVTLESVAFRWVPKNEVNDLPLHPGFAATWPQLIDLPYV
jgi:8-oxo-dGTP diphosphatase